MLTNPAFDGMRATPCFQALLTRIDKYIAAERLRIDAMERAEQEAESHPGKPGSQCGPCHLNPTQQGGPQVPLHSIMAPPVCGPGLRLLLRCRPRAGREPDRATDKSHSRRSWSRRAGADESSIAVPMSLTRLDGAILDSLQYRDIDAIPEPQPWSTGYKPVVMAPVR